MLPDTGYVFVTLPRWNKPNNPLNTMTYLHVAVVFAISTVKIPLSRETKHCRFGHDCDKINLFALNLCKGFVSHQEILGRPPVWPLILSDAHKYLCNSAYVGLKPIVACY